MTELNPQFTNADKILSRFTKYKKGDNHIENMKQRLEKFSLNDFNKSNILFALGKAYEDIKDYEKSLLFLDEANNLLKKITKYDFSNDENLFKNLIEKFSNFEFKEINKKI